MKMINILESMEYVDAGFIEEAEDYKRKSKAPYWIKYGAAAACLILVAAAGVLLNRQIHHSPLKGGGSTPDAGGLLFPEGVDPVIYSVAVYPETEEVQNVDTAVVNSVSEEELKNIPLAEHLPAILPEGFHFGRGSIYETVMKDGTLYHMLRIEYITGTIPEQQYSEDGGAIAPDPNAIGDQFQVTVTDFAPRSNIYMPGEVTREILAGAEIPYIQYGDFYVGIAVEATDPEAVLEVLESIR